jgi:hypothetical protein
MNAALPKYMNVKGFCQYSGFSYYQFMRLADKAGIKIKALGRDRRNYMVDVAEALRAIDNLPEADKEVPMDLMREEREKTDVA